jgi:hypothetical protein
MAIFIFLENRPAKRSRIALKWGMMSADEWPRVYRGGRIEG